ncbi:hypothetical protein ACLOJK_031063 [Asimina triloba]
MVMSWPGGAENEDDNQNITGSYALSCDPTHRTPRVYGLSRSARAFDVMLLPQRPEPNMSRTAMLQTCQTRTPLAQIDSFRPDGARGDDISALLFDILAPSRGFSADEFGPRGFLNMQQELGMDMMRSSKGLTEEEDDEDESSIRQDGPSSQKGDSSAKDARINDQRANTPRFQILRDLIPNSSDQKRDKASFLLEDGMPVVKHSQPQGETIVDHAQTLKNGPTPGSLYTGRFDDDLAATPAMLGNMQNPLESDNLSTGALYKPMDHNQGLASKAVPAPMTLQQNMYAIGRSDELAQASQQMVPDAENSAAQSQPQVWPRQYSAESEMLNEQEELMIEGGTIRMSSIYSQGIEFHMIRAELEDPRLKRFKASEFEKPHLEGFDNSAISRLLSNLTQALQSSGIDLSQANISVQIDVGKRAIMQPPATSSMKDLADPSSSNQAMPHPRVVSSCIGSDLPPKRLKMDNS